MAQKIGAMMGGTRMPRSVAAIGFAALFAVGSALAADSGCGPFGDGPAEVRRGIVASFVSDHNPICIGATVLGPWQDPSGSERYACSYEPRAAGADDPLPLVIFLHGSLATADSILFTGLRARIDDADLGGAKAGFILLAPEGRDTSHFYPGIDANAIGWDNWYRQLSPNGSVTIANATYEENADAAAIDHFVQDEVSTGKVDRRRIYVTGWSNGAAMAILYALDRPQIAAAAVYSAPNPFGAFNDRCPQRPVAGSPADRAQLQLFNPRVPILHLRNSCDIAGICPNGDALASELRAVRSNLDDEVLDSSGSPVGRCDDSCGTSPMGDGSVGVWGSVRGLQHHIAWPRRWNDRIFTFLRMHPLVASP